MTGLIPIVGNTLNMRLNEYRLIEEALYQSEKRYASGRNAETYWTSNLQQEPHI
jgi:hypothetical protein